VGGPRHGYIVGAGSQGSITAEVWRAQVPGVSLRFLDDAPALQGAVVGGIRVEAGVEALADLDAERDEAVLAIGNNPRRLALSERYAAVPWACVIHPSAVVMPSAVLGAGTTVLANAVVNTRAHVGRHVIINTGAIIEHDAVVEDGCSISPGVSMGGAVHLGRGVFLSAGVTLAPRVRIGAGSIIGAGAVVVEDIPAHVLAYGVPARVVRSLDDFDFRRLL